MLHLASGHVLAEPVGGIADRAIDDIGLLAILTVIGLVLPSKEVAGRASISPLRLATADMYLIVY